MIDNDICVESFRSELNEIFASTCFNKALIETQLLIYYSGMMCRVLSNDDFTTISNKAEIVM